MTNEHGIPAYLESSDKFIAHRLNYYADARQIKTSDVESRVFPKDRPDVDLEQRQEVVGKLGATKTDVIVSTSTYNRPEDILKGYAVIASQRRVDWKWLIVDNGNEKQTERLLKDLKDDRVYYIRFNENGGCASPVRNFGLDVIHLAKKSENDEGQVMVIDSDDRLYNEYSLAELLKVAKSSVTRLKDTALVHGYSATEIHDDSGNVTYVPNPRDLGSDFPRVNNLKEVFDKGLNILAGMFPLRLLGNLRYPKEFSFEDDGFNQKLLLYAKKHNLIWAGDNIPTTVKIFHEESMSGVNNKRGDVSKKSQIGLHKVSGIRASIVSYLHDITDYYTKEGL